MNIKLSQQSAGTIGVCGHVGVGHVHSHSGFVQDDSAGFSAAARLLQKAIPADTAIVSVDGDLATGTVSVRTACGGFGSVCARRGITPAEAKILQTAIGHDAVFPQNVAVNTFGRLYGQGVLEVPTALAGAAALAALDSFHRAAPENFRLTKSDIDGKYDRFGGAVIDIGTVPIAVLLVVNGADGGIGPDEDYEGNTNWEKKGALMGSLGLTRIPTIILESKAYIPALSKQIQENTYLVRAQDGVDCLPLAESLTAAGQRIGLPMRLEKNMMPLAPGSLSKATRAFAERIKETAEKLAAANSSAEKVRLTAQLAQLVSEDAGGVTFMSNSINDQVRGAGILPGNSAVLSMITTQAYQSYWKIPMFEEQEAEAYGEIICHTAQTFEISKKGAAKDK